MGSGSFSASSYSMYNTSRGKLMDVDTGRMDEGDEDDGRGDSVSDCGGYFGCAGQGPFLLLTGTEEAGAGYDRG